jgi:hypothetical protein
VNSQPRVRKVFDRFFTIALAIVLATLNGPAKSFAAEDEPPPHAAEAVAPISGPKPEPITPPKPEEITASIERGVKFLLDDERDDGSWGGPEKSKSFNIYAPPPGAHDAFRTAVTSLVVMSLIEAEPCVASSERPPIDKAIQNGSDWLDENLAHLKRATPDALYNIWGHAYAVQCLTELHKRAHGDADRQTKLKELAQQQADMLARYSFVGGGWSYYDLRSGTQTPGDSAFSFLTATALIALKQSESIGVTFPDRLTKKAIESLLRQQKPDFSYAYGEYTMRDPRYYERPAGSLGRSQACNLALLMYDDKHITQDVLKTWLDRLFARNGWLSMARKRPIPHDSYFQVAGYFYFYGHWYASMCIDQLPAAERPYFQDHLAHIILPLQEKDGSWWDYPLYDYHQQYGTAMAVMTLVRCQKSK